MFLLKPWANLESTVAEMQDIRIKNAAMTTAADVVAKAQVVSEPELLRAMFDVGYFPPNTPPDAWVFKAAVRLSGSVDPSQSAVPRLGLNKNRLSCLTAGAAITEPNGS
jgi:hypothetical protein